MNKALDIIDKTMYIENLTAEIVREFIEKIIIHYRIKKDCITTQKVEIYYNVIEKFELPPLYNLNSSENETQTITY